MRKTVLLYAMLLLSFSAIDQALAKEPFYVLTNKSSYGPGETVKVTLRNESDTKVFYSGFSVEKKNSAGDWETLKGQAMEGVELYYDRIASVEIQPHGTAELEWGSFVYRLGDRNWSMDLPDDGIYRIKIPYGPDSGAGSYSAITPEFTLAVDNVKAMILAGPANGRDVKALTMKALDNDGNSLWDNLVIEGGIDTPKRGEYFLEGYLYNENPFFTQLRRFRKKVVLEKGWSVFTAQFDINSLSQENLPVSGFVITARGPDGAVLIREWKNDGKYRPAEFEGAVLRFSKDGLKDEITADGKLKVSAKVSVFKNVDTAITCYLWPPDEQVDLINKGRDKLGSCARFTLAPGEREIAFNISGEYFISEHIKGPFKVVLVTSGEFPGDYLDTGYLIRSDLGSFGKKVFLGNYLTEPVDINADGITDKLAFSFDVDIPSDGQYGVSLLLEDKNHLSFSSFATLSGSGQPPGEFLNLKQGRCRLTMEFKWIDILGHGVDGPYYIRGKILDQNVKLLDDMTFVTPAYKFKGQEAPVISAPQSKEPIPAEFSVVELVSNNLPQSIEFWTTAYCPDAGSAMGYKVPAGYRVESCEGGPVGSHGGCSFCAVSKIRLVKGEDNLYSEPGVCGSAVNQEWSSMPAENLCAQGTLAGMGCYSSHKGGCNWCWTCGQGRGKVTCCGKE